MDENETGLGTWMGAAGLSVPGYREPFKLLTGLSNKQAQIPF